MQTTHSNSTNSCESELSDLKNYGGVYVSYFEAEHIDDHKRVHKIKEMFDQFGNILSYFTRSEYGKDIYGRYIDLEYMKSEVNAFALEFYQHFLNVSDLFIRLERGITILVELTACLVANYNLTCEDGSNLSGCTAKLNQVRCTLAKLTNQVPDAAELAFDIVSFLKYEENILNQKTSKFSARYYLPCNSYEPVYQCRKSDPTMQTLKNFLKNFEDIYKEMQIKFEILLNLCNSIVLVIDIVKAEFNLL